MIMKIKEYTRLMMIMIINGLTAWEIDLHNPMSTCIVDEFRL